MTFHVGQKVVCIAGRVKANFNPVQPQLGGIYIIRDIFVSSHGTPSLRLIELVSPIHSRTGVEYGFYASRFRPVVKRKTDISIFTAMLNPSKQGVDA